MAADSTSNNTREELVVVEIADGVAHTKTIQNARAVTKFTSKKGAESLKKLGRVRFCLFKPDAPTFCGVLIKRPDLLWMIRRKDVFVTLDGIDWEASKKGQLVLKENYKELTQAALKKSKLKVDECVIWTGLPVRTKCGDFIGRVGNLAFNTRTGNVIEFNVDRNASSNFLLGRRMVTAADLEGFKPGIGAFVGDDADKVSLKDAGAIVVSDDVLVTDPEGGAAQVAGTVTAKTTYHAKRIAQKTAPKVAKVQADITDKTAKAVNDGAYALGKQLGKMPGMFESFREEFKKGLNDDPKDK